MREILFRGKRVDNGEWVYGYYARFRNFRNEVYDGIWRVCDDETKESEFQIFAVLPETVGQFTGLCDEVGRKIFEGDIVENPQGTQGFVEWQNVECAFLVNIGDDWQTMDDCTYEVIGNIYDNEEEE